MDEDVATPKNKGGRPKGSRNRPKEGEDIKPDTPPRDRKPERAKGPTWAKAAQVEKTLTGTIETLGLGVGILNKIDGEIIEEGAAPLAKALVDLATVDPRYRKMIEGASAPGKYGPLLIASSGIILPILTNHALIGAEKKIKEVEVTSDIEQVVEESIAQSPISEGAVIGSSADSMLISDTLNNEGSDSELYINVD